MAVGRTHLGVTFFGGDTTLSVGNTQVLLEGIFGGGDFMAVARGQGSNAHTMVTFEPFLPNLFEGVRVDAQAINGVVNEPFMTGDGAVRFTMKLEAAVSTFANSLGFYKVAADGTIFDTHVCFPTPTTFRLATMTVSLGTPADAVRIGFFLIQDGFDIFGDLPDNLAFLTPGTLAPANLNAGVPADPGERHARRR